MANPEHVEVFRGGTEAILAWRQEHPGETLDLRGARLEGISLWPFRGKRETLPRDRVALEGACFDGATLCECHFSSVELSGVSFKDAGIGMTTFSWCRMFQADFTEADMFSVTFENCSLDRATFESARWAYINLVGTAMRHTKGLKDLRIDQPGCIDPRSARGFVHELGRWAPNYLAKYGGYSKWEALAAVLHDPSLPESWVKAAVDEMLVARLGTQDDNRNS